MKKIYMSKGEYSVGFHINPTEDRINMKWKKIPWIKYFYYKKRRIIKNILFISLFVFVFVIVIKFIYFIGN